MPSTSMPAVGIAPKTVCGKASRRVEFVRTFQMLVSSALWVIVLRW